MKTILTLKASSMLFLGGINLYRHQPVEVDSTTLTDKDVRILNRVIKSGAVESTAGLFEEPTEDVVIEAVIETPIAEVETVAEPTVQEKVAVTPTEETVEEKAPAEEEKPAAATAKKRTTKKKTA